VEREAEVESKRSRLVIPPACGLRYAATAAALVLALAISGMAQQARVYREGSVWIEESTGSLPAAANLSVRMDIGNVNVQGGNHSGIDYTLKKRVRAATQAEAQRQFELFHFSAARPRPGDLAILSGIVYGASPTLSGDLQVQVPRGMQLVKVAIVKGGNETVIGVDGRTEVWTSAGNIRVDDIGGAVQANSGGGNFVVGKVGGDLTVNTGGGSIHVDSVRGNAVTSTGGGNVYIGSVARALSVRTGGGSIEVKQCAGNMNAVTGGGIIRLTSADGPVTASSRAGAIQLLGLAHGANVHTDGGGIVAEFLGHDFTASSVQTQNGDIIVYLGPDLKATVQAEVEMANGHHLRSSLPEIVVTPSGDPSSLRSIRAEGNLKGGGPLLRVRAINGDIEFRRAQH